MSKKIEEFMKKVVEKNPGEVEFHQAVKEVAESVLPLLRRILNTRKLKS